MISLDVSSINSVQNIMLANLSSGLGILVIYAKRLLYYFIAFEIVLSGLGWALYQNQYAERLFFQILKIGLILFVVGNYTYLLNTILDSMVIIGHKIAAESADKILLNPGMIWQYGYNFALSLLQSAATAEGFAMPMILVFLGFGILLVIGIFGIQVFLQIVGFYLIALVSLLSIPLSVFSPLKDFFSQSIKSILQAAIRLMVQMLIVSAALTLWSQMQLQSFDNSMNINIPLGFLFSGLLFVLASFYLPKLAEKVIGNIQTQAPATNHQYQTNTIATPMLLQNNTTSINAATMTTASSMTSSLNHLISQNSLVTHHKSAIPRDTIKNLLAASEPDLNHKQKSTSENHEEIDKIKQAFYEVLTELEDEKKVDNTPS